MVSLLKKHLAEESGSSGEPYLAVIHRLDQPTSGLLVFAKTKEAARDLNRQIREKTFGKFYLAELRSIPIPREGTLEHYLVKDPHKNIMHVCDADTPEPSWPVFLMPLFRSMTIPVVSQKSLLIPDASTRSVHR